MTAYRNKYLEMLKCEKSQKPPGEEPTKLTKRAHRSSPYNCVGFVSSQVGAFSGFSPPLDAEGVPCGGCPNCNQGEFWRRPKFHKDHDSTGWVCWFCSPPPEDPYCADFCGVPDRQCGFGDLMPAGRHTFMTRDDAWDHAAMLVRDAPGVAILYDRQCEVEWTLRHRSGCREQWVPGGARGAA